MKHLIFFLSLFAVMPMHGQAMFFDKLKNSTWIYEGTYTDPIFRNAKAIGIGELTVSKDILRVNSTLWSFGENLVVSSYNVKDKTEKILATYQYEIDRENNILKISPDETHTFTYTVGIVSTGSYAVLTRVQE